MRILLALFLMGLVPVAMVALPAPVSHASEQLSPADQETIRDIIRQQFDAFRREDGKAAFALASPGIQGMFGSARNFMAMVRQSYPQVYRPQEVEFRDIVDMNGRPTQRVLLIGPDGKPVIALYSMERQPDGSWRIDGCMLAKSDEMTV